MNRREFLGLVGGLLATAAVPAFGGDAVGKTVAAKPSAKGVYKGAGVTGGGKIFAGKPGLVLIVQ